MNLLIEQLKRHEGVMTHAYTCPEGKVTIGVGRNIDPRGGLGLSEDEIDILLSNDILRCTKELEQFEWFRYLDEIRKAALVNMCFNIGLTKLLQFKNMIACLDVADYNGAAEEALDSRWAKQVGDRAKELAEQIRTGCYEPE
jgi:lysozyme